MHKRGISIIYHGQFDQEFLEKIARAVEAEFRLPVQVSDYHLDLSGYFNPSRRQYDANALLEILKTATNKMPVKTVGLFEVDLFIPILTYIFGQAVFRGNTAITSVYRLRNEQYGLKENNKLLLERIQKVIIHELGHSFGLVHCHDPVCVMRPASYVEDIDQKKQLFCPKCSNELEGIIGSKNS